MKRFIFLLVAFLPLFVFGQKAKIDFQETSHVFGTISEGNGKVSYDFKYKNAGNAPLILTNVRAGCGCTTPEWSREPLAPGAEGSIKVTFDPRNRPGSFIKSITVNSNAENPVVSLTIRGNVSRKAASPYDAYQYAIGKVKTNTNAINLGNIKNNQKLSKTIELINTAPELAHISASTGSPYITVEATPATLQKGQKGNINILYDATKVNDWGFVNDIINVKVNDREEGEIKVIANLSEDFSQYKDGFETAPRIKLTESQAELKDLTPNTTYTHDFYIQNEGKSELIIRKIKTSAPDFSVHLSKNTIKPGKKVKASVTFKTSAPKSAKIIQLTTNDPQNTIVSYKLTTLTK